MSEWLESALDIVFALGALLIFAIAFGQSIDNHAGRLDPASPEYSRVGP